MIWPQKVTTLTNKITKYTTILQGITQTQIESYTVHKKDFECVTITHIYKINVSNITLRYPDLLTIIWLIIVCSVLFMLVFQWFNTYELRRYIWSQILLI